MLREKPPETERGYQSQVVYVALGVLNHPNGDQEIFTLGVFDHREEAEGVLIEKGFERGRSNVIACFRNVRLHIPTFMLSK